MKEKEVVEYNKMIAKIADGNRIIAEFMGAKIIPNQGEAKIEHFVFDDDRLAIWDLKYNSSWDWLMPVVNKIKELKHPIYLYQSHVQNTVEIFEMKNDHYIIRESDTMGEPIMVLWKAIVQFIKMHNKK